jgi:uncharacterized membrane protein
VPACTNCDRQVSEAARFCPTCGTDIPQPQAIPAPIAPQATAVASVPVSAKPRNVPELGSAHLPENIAGMLAYFIFPTVVFLVVRPFNRNRFVRFHSFQCLLTAAVLIGLQVALALFGKFIPLFVLPIYGLLFLAELTLWLLLFFKAYQHEEFQLPVIGNIAQRWAEKN